MLKMITPEVGNYIAGFTDGEGSFNVSLKKRDDYTYKWKIAASFNISQKDRVILAKIKTILGCGTLRERPDGVVYYEVTNIKSLQEVIIPFFDKFGFWSSYKKSSYSIFRQIVKKMYNNEHLETKGFKEILDLREKLNVGIGRKRKYTKDNINV
jgi:hypothetical protein